MDSECRRLSTLSFSRAFTFPVSSQRRSSANRAVALLPPEKAMANTGPAISRRVITSSSQRARRRTPAWKQSWKHFPHRSSAPWAFRALAVSGLCRLSSQGCQHVHFKSVGSGFDPRTPHQRDLQRSLTNPPRVRAFRGTSRSATAVHTTHRMHGPTITPRDCILLQLADSTAGSRRETARLGSAPKAGRSCNQRLQRGLLRNRPRATVRRRPAGHLGFTRRSSKTPHVIRTRTRGLAHR